MAPKIKNTVVFVGRLEADTGILKFLQWLVRNKNYRAEFIGDGSLRSKCANFGRVHGFGDPKPFMRKAEICVPAGYLSYIEAKSMGCKMKVFPNSPLKKDYWAEIQAVKKFPTWNEIADEYLTLWKR